MLTPEVERDATVAGADLQHGLGVEIVGESVPQRRDLAGQSLVVVGAGRSSRDRGRNVVVGGLRLPLTLVGGLFLARALEDPVSLDELVQPERCCVSRGLHQLGAGAPAGSQSTRPIQRSRFSAYQAIVCRTPSSHETRGSQPVSPWSFS